MWPWSSDNARPSFGVYWYLKQLERRSLKKIRFSTGFKYESFHIYFTSFHSSREDMNAINWPSSPLKPWFFQASSFQLLKLENLLRWSFSTFIYNRSTNMNYFIYTSRHFNPHGKTWTQLIDLAPNVWLHSSVGRASHRYRGGHGFKSRWSPDFFQASSFQLLKLENLLRWSFSTFRICSLKVYNNLKRA